MKTYTLTEEQMQAVIGIIENITETLSNQTSPVAKCIVTWGNEALKLLRSIPPSDDGAVEWSDAHEKIADKLQRDYPKHRSSTYKDTAAAIYNICFRGAVSKACNHAFSDRTIPASCMFCGEKKETYGVIS